MSKKLTDGKSLLRWAGAFAAAAVAAKPTSARISKSVLYFYREMLLGRSVFPSDVAARSFGRTHALLGHRTNVERATATFPSSPGDRQYPRHSEYDPRMYQHQYENDVDADEEPEDQ